mmetsp:Transcript_89574/g.172404  ORF Transcript_89574/g.172404 Transcript_89574/m.172404 type:complete len:342 (+) Transcript_89574:30-1055(+)
MAASSSGSSRRRGGSDEYGNFQFILGASTIGSLGTCLLLTPLDVARHSTQAALRARVTTPTALDALRAAAQPGAVSGLWRGLPWALGRASFTPLSFLLVYEQQKGSKDAFEAGLWARTAQTLFVQPLDFLRTLRQADAIIAPDASAHLRRSVMAIISSDGGRSFWRGLLPTLARDVGASGVCWACYSGLRRGFGVGDFSGDGDWDTPPNGLALSLAVLASASAATAAMLTQPFDVVKTRMQIHEQVRSDKEGYRRSKLARVSQTFRDVYKMGGLPAFWTGGVHRVLSAAIAGLLLGPFYEFAQNVSDDSLRPVRKPFILPKDPSSIIVHPRATKTMFIEVK